MTAMIQRAMSVILSSASDRFPHDGARHAVTSAASLAELEARDLHDLHPCLAHLGDRERVALVGHDHTGLERDDVVAVIPLLSLLLIAIPPGLHDVKLRDTEGIGHRGDEILVLADVERTGFGAWPEADGTDSPDHLGIGGRLVAIEEICSIIRACVRSLRPIATVPLPMISTSPPSSDESPKSSALKRLSSPMGGYQ